MQTIATERLILRHYQKSEGERFIDLFTDETVMKNVDHGVLSLFEAQNLWDKLINHMYPKGVDTIYAVFEKQTQDYVGHASIRPRPSKPEDSEIGYILHKFHWNKGFATEIAKHLIYFGMNSLGLEQVFATIDDDNEASINVAIKAGMRFLRHEFDEEGRFSVYSITNNAADELKK